MYLKVFLVENFHREFIMGDYDREYLFNFFFLRIRKNKIKYWDL